jgi:hypothetical protein
MRISILSNKFITRILKSILIFLEILFYFVEGFINNFIYKFFFNIYVRYWILTYIILKCLSFVNTRIQMWKCPQMYWFFLITLIMIQLIYEHLKFQMISVSGCVSTLMIFFKNIINLWHKFLINFNITSFRVDVITHIMISWLYTWHS